jgi:hypothetical protein
LKVRKKRENKTNQDAGKNENHRPSCGEEKNEDENKAG